MIFAGFGDPAAHAIFRSAHFDGARKLWAIGDSPVEPVPSHVDKPPALMLIGKQGVHHRQRIVLGVGARHHAVVSFNEAQSLGLQVIIRHHVEGVAFFLQPVGNVTVCVVLP